MAFNNRASFGALPKHWPCAPDAGDAPAGGASAPKEDTKADEAPAPKSFSQEELNSILAKEKRRTEAQLKAATEKSTALETKLNDLLQRFEEKEKNDPHAKTEEGKIEAILRKHQREQEELRKEIEENKKAAAAERQARLEAQRDRLLDEALVAAGCVDLKAGRRYFLPEVTREDPEDGTTLEEWALKTPSGKLIDIASGVGEHLPKYMRSPNANVGGAGTTSGGPKAKEKDRIKVLEAELVELQKKAQALGDRNGPAVQQYMQKQRELKALKSTVTKGP